MFKRISAAILALALTACTSSTKPLIVAPQLPTNVNAVYQGQGVTVNIQDLRRQQHIVQVLKQGDAAKLHSAANDVSATIANTLKNSWVQQGLTIDGGQVHINIFLDAALVSVQQQTMKYTASSEIRLRVEVQKHDSTQTTNFKSTGNSNGPLYADIAVLERDFNQQLGKVISDILNNQDIQNFIRG